MAVTSGALTVKADSGTPYQLNNDQVLNFFPKLMRQTGDMANLKMNKSQVVRASSALLKHITTEEKQKAETSTKKNLLADNDDEDASDVEDSAATPVWLIMTTKKHIVDKNRLKPGKIVVPHSLNTSPSLTICLITADPQRAVKDAIADPAFPTSLSSRINKVIGISKLKAKYQSFESRRRLLSEHDIFLADDRIIMRLVDALGKIFYKSSKRPIPIRIAEVQKVNGQKVKKEDRKRPATADEKYSAVASPAVVAKEIERTLNSVPVHLAAAATTAVRVGSANFSPEKVAENVEAVVQGMTEKFVTKGWRNVKAIHLKGANTMAMPIWLASELWVEEGDVKEDEVKAIEDSKKKGKKRKSVAEGEQEEKKSKKSKSAEKEVDEDAELIASRKAKLQAQKAKALSEGDKDARNKAKTVAVTTTEGASTSTKKKRKSVSKS
ncbi:hypothetical protein FQN52_004308 [Onygenales sp. PD_12]|nr:hypothetical protein FQN52_004308 [Onygenales sp. PD_12]